MAVPVINLSILNGDNGFQLNSEKHDLGSSVSNAGDVNGDGFGDVIVNALSTSYVVFGKASGFDAMLDLSNLNGNNGFRMNGVGSYAGGSVSTAGDVDGDGFDDVIVGAPGADSGGTRSGSSYVVFGKASGFNAALDLSNLNGNNGFRLDGDLDEENSGRSVSNAGDVNGDSFDDLIVNSTHGSDVIFGKASGFDAAMSLASLDGSNGFHLEGDGFSYGLSSVSNAGDVNGDGFDDLIVGVPNADLSGENSGSSYVIFGKASGFDATLELSDLDGSNGFRLDGATKYDYSGTSVSTAGDLNGDGFSDLIIGAREVKYSLGASYVVFGKASGFSAAIKLASMNGKNGFRLEANSINADDAIGSVSNAGDVNDDGLADLIVGAYKADPNNAFGHAGASYVVFGKTSAFDATLNLSNLDGDDGFRLDGISENDYSGRSVSTAGDVNGDGFSDLMIGAPNARYGYGAGYVVFGGDFLDEGIYRGTPGDDTLTGTTAAEHFEVGDGNDIVIGRGGADIFQGGAGNDTLLTADLNFQSMDGGIGTDTLELTEGNLNLDLSNFHGRINGIETIDLGDNFDSGNTLTLTLQDLLSLSDTTDTFTINGGKSDHVVGLVDGWTDEGLEGNYHIYTNSGAVLRINSAVGTDLPVSGIFSLANLNGSNGFRLDGVTKGDQSGTSVSNAGDVNGDGFDDVIIGAPSANSSSGISYVVFGKASGFDAAMNLSILDGNNGFRLDGIQTYAEVSGAGDVNGDGFNDVSINAPDGGYVVFGKASGFNPTINLSNLDGNDGFHLQGAKSSSDFSNKAVIDNAGDINGDGYDDVIIGSPYAGPSYQNYIGGWRYSLGYGASYVVFGKAAGFNADMDLSHLDGSNGFRVDGIFKNELLGKSVGSAGDVNGDGFDDLIIGAPGRNFGSSETSYIVFGKASGFDATMTLSNLDGNNGFSLEGAGKLVSTAGDINGDGFDDVIIGRHDRSYVVFGKASGFDAAIVLSDLDGKNGFRLEGVAQGSFSAASASNAGDVNGDGFDDLIVGAEAVGASYVLFGKAADFDAVMNVSSIVSNNGFRLEGVIGYGSGKSVSTAGDVNNDGFDDLIVGAPGASPNGFRSGSNYVIFGRKDFTGEAIYIGTAGDDTLTGTTTTERFEGKAGNDRMIGNGGADVFLGEAGDDTIVVPDLNFQSVDGGIGADTLELTGGDFKDLADFHDSIHGIETIDLGRFSSNTLTLTLQDLLSLSDTTNTFTIDGGNRNHLVGLKDGWLDDGMEGNYHIYTNSGTVLRVGSAITTDVPVRGVIHLSDLNGDNGFRMDGVSDGDLSGHSVSNAGDVNGDGFDDVIIGSYGVNSSYVVFGKASGFDASLDLSSLTGNNGFRLDGAGESVSTAGDINGDGFDDLIVSNGGNSYVIFGKTSGFDAVMDLSNLDGNNGFMLDGYARSISNAGDVNGDGFDDVIVGNPYAYLNGNSSGSSYIVFGKTLGFGATLDLSSLDGNNGFRLDGLSENDRSGKSVSNAGDVNGDGFDDLIIGALGTANEYAASGSDYVVFGKASGFEAAMDLSILDGNNGFRLDSSVANSFLGKSVNSAGDVNGDGFDDLFVGSRGTNQEGYNSSYVVFGKAADFDAVMDLANLNGSNGFRLDGTSASGFPTVSVSSAGDVNGDGFDDLIIGFQEAVSYSTGTIPGFSYVMFGKASGFDAVVNISSLVDNNGVRMEGADGDLSGHSVSGAGDVNGDGFDDLFVGAILADENGFRSGSSYVIFGRRDFSGENSGNNILQGTPGDDTLTGTGAAERFEAGDGNDRMIGHGGADVFHGGAGNDRIRVADLGFHLADGGSGNNDVLSLGGGGNLNLDLADVRGKISGIEIIYLHGGSGDKTLTLNVADVLNLSDTSNTLKINGNEGDRVVLQGDWSDGGIQGGFHTYTSDAAASPEAAVLLVGIDLTADFA